jgi:phosphatidylethanolamine/phosphatidyl-N-methylethanolamine N-methyltransferase
MPPSAKLKQSAIRHFLYEAIFQPQRIGAVLPSSKYLCNAMARWIPKDFKGYALELGPGTGAVTDALLKHGLAEDRLIAIEKSPVMAELLQQRFPRAKIISGDAFKLDDEVRSHARHVEQLGIVFSSLPLRNFHPSMSQELARRVRTLLAPGGRFVLYTYRIASAPRAAFADFRWVGSRIVWRNVPPARVTVYEH